VNISPKRPRLYAVNLPKAAWRHANYRISNIKKQVFLSWDDLATTLEATSLQIN
jgi:hypothetical protein